MNEKQESIIEAAIRVIWRYGIKRSTMNDYADEAGVSRRTVYSIYPTKEALLRATIRHMTDERLVEIDARCGAADTLAEKIDIILDVLTVQMRATIDAAPDAADVISHMTAAGKDELLEAADRYRQAILDVLAPYRLEIEAAGLTHEGLASYLQATTKSIMKDARDQAHMTDLLGTVKTLVLAAIRVDGQ